MPLVSIIIPNYNHSLFLEKRIDSILNQTFQDIELIILDDCSTDHSQEVIERYRNNPKVSQIIFNEVNSGSTFKQWDKGINLARGEIIWIAESDDFCEPTFLEELVPAFQHNTKIAVAYCQTLCVDTEDKITYRTLTDYLSETIDGHQFLKSKMLGSNSIVNASMAVFRKRNVALFSGEYKEMKYCGDWLFWVNLCFTGDVYISGKYLNYYLRHDKNVATNATRQGYDFLEGNEIYHFISGKINVLESERQMAIKERVIEYLRARDNFLDDNIHRQVEIKMLQLDPGIKKIIRKMTRKDNALKYLSALNRILP